MERWRSFFGSSGEDLWTVIDRAITIAAIDYPQELRVRRDAFAEKLFAPASHFSTANIADGPRLDVRVENLFGPNLCPLTSSIGERPALTRSDGGTGASPESETKDVLEGQQKNPEITFHDSTVVVNCKSLKEEEVLPEESEESRQIREILVIKERIMNLDQTEETCLLALSMLENMNICVPALKATGIGKPVNGLRKHSSRRVRSIAKRLVSFWKDVVDEWVTKKGDDFAAAFVDSGTSDINGNEIGMISPCENNRAMPANGTGSPKILDTRDHDLSGSWQITSSEHRHIVTNLSGASLAEERQPQSNFQICNPHMNSYNSDLKVHKDKWDHEIKEKLECAGGGSKTALDCIGNSSNKLDAVHRSNFAHKPPDPSDAVQKQKLYKAGADTKPKCTESSHELHRLEAAKRRLHENYQQAEKVKKQRTIQVVDMETAPTGPSTQPKYNWTGHHAKPGINTKKACPANIR
ncbi:hypothetical protein O6H91_23G003900 [Diphasiastrum complanatum]|uniref:Uncharacterized protein n=1 Tax=Diphasiastrum complanatum TaxID=34168 RepID=A0ACC2A8S7_DIPCM|nr:hypothetical protein O6H91_23G003900 [Diphasiastrum complanatum]